MERLSQKPGYYRPTPGKVEIQLEIDHVCLLDDFWCKGVARSGTVALGRGTPPYKVKYILNLKLTQYNRWKLSVGLVCDLGQL